MVQAEGLFVVAKDFLCVMHSCGELAYMAADAAFMPPGSRRTGKGRHPRLVIRSDVKRRRRGDFRPVRRANGALTGRQQDMPRRA